jgi:DNA-binding response OmpR family regulator
MRHILVVDDEKEIGDLISIYLKNDGFQVSRAYHGQEALDIFEREEIDLLILDIMMPGIDGIEVCRRIREKHLIPILMLSAKAEDMDKIIGLMTGADDYMIKPFNPLELVARVKSLIRRSFQYSAELAKPKQEETIRLNSLVVNKTFHTVQHQDRDIPLTSKEFDILYLLVTHRGRVFSAEEIFELVWKERYLASNNTVMVHISNLRDKLEKELGYKLIKTVWGVGYKIEV